MNLYLEVFGGTDKEAKHHVTPSRASLAEDKGAHNQIDSGLEF
jgi:hypothetical protein